MSKTASRRSLGSDLKRVDAHRIRRSEYKELPELTEEMLRRAVVNRAAGLALKIRVNSFLFACRLKW